MDRRIPLWVRLYLLVVVFETVRVAIGLFRPGVLQGMVPWPASPLNARFIASIYAALGIGVLACALARHYEEIRIVVIGILIMTTLLLCLTLIRYYAFPGEIPTFPVLWIVAYTVDPLLAFLTVWRLGWRREAGAGRNPYAPVWWAETAVFGLLGLFLLLSPSAAVRVWPWAMTIPQAQLYSGLFITIAALSAIAGRESRWRDIRWFVLVLAVLPVLVLISSFMHLDRFRHTSSTILWFPLFAIQLLAFGAMMARETAAGSLKGAPRWKNS